MNVCSVCWRWKVIRLIRDCEQAVPEPSVSGPALPGPSASARAVAAHRLRFERLEAGFGDPAADQRLSADVAGGIEIDPEAPISRYLRGRTKVFDRVVLRALERGNRQIVILGAGYDGRAWRYASNGVRFFEVDRMPTQADKRERLTRLGIDTDRVTFVAADFNQDDVAELLIEAGFEPEESALFICEGVVAYLEPATVARLFSQVRSLATGGTRLAVSHRVPGASPERRAALAAHVAAGGEPFRFGETDLSELLFAARWVPNKVSEGAERIGLISSRPLWSPGELRTRSGIGQYFERTFYTEDVRLIGRRVASVYGVEVRDSEQITGSVTRLTLADGDAWIARVAPIGTPVQSLQRSVDAMRFASAHGIDAERPVAGDPILSLGDRPVLLTRAVAGTPLKVSSVTTAAMLGDLLGRLHALPDPPPALGGAWHYLSATGGTADEVAGLRALIGLRHGLPAWVESDVAEIEASIAALEALPTAFSHADFVSANVLAGEAPPTLVDWAGAGVMPRIWALGYFLFSLGLPELARAALGAYVQRVDLADPEWNQLELSMSARPTLLQIWGLVTGRSPIDADEHRRERRARLAQMAAALRADRAAGLFAHTAVNDQTQGSNS